MKHKGIICGILAAVCYGTNPFGALPLYEEGVNTSSVLFYRFSMAVLMLAVMLLIERKSFRVSSGELKTLGSLGLLFAASSITYYQSFRFMDAGIASTILFVYPVMVAVIMATCFREKVTSSTVTAIILALVGIGLLYRGDAGVSLSTLGILLVMVSSLTYAIYIVVVNQSSIRMSSLKLTFYVLLICMLCLLAYSFTSPDLHLMLPPSPRAWFFACWLGLVPTVLSLVLMTVAVHEVGATPTAHAYSHHGSLGAIDCGSHRRNGVWRIAHPASCRWNRTHPFSRPADCAWQKFPSAYYRSCHHLDRQKDLAMEIISLIINR